MKTLGQFIKDLRDKKDLSLRELAGKINCSAAFLSDIELGKRFPSEEILTKLAFILGIKKIELEKYDVRGDVEDFKKMSHADPGYAFAFRQVVEKKIDPKDLLNAIKKIQEK